MIEDRLRDTLDRVATGGPDEAGGYDRFLRRRPATPGGPRPPPPSPWWPCWPRP